MPASASAPKFPAKFGVHLPPDIHGRLAKLAPRLPAFTRNALVATAISGGLAALENYADDCERAAASRARRPRRPSKDAVHGSFYDDVPARRD